MLFFEMAEILRRTVWAVFRIEWECVVKVHRLSHDTRALMESEEPDEMEMQPLETAGRGVDD